MKIYRKTSRNGMYQQRRCLNSYCTLYIYLNKLQTYTTHMRIHKQRHTNTLLYYGGLSCTLIVRYNCIYIVYITDVLRVESEQSKHKLNQMKPTNRNTCIHTTKKHT